MRSSAGLGARLDVPLYPRRCIGVTLTTGNPRNLRCYSRFCYRVTGHSRVGSGLETWAHFRATQEAFAASGTSDGQQ